MWLLPERLFWGCWKLEKDRWNRIIRWGKELREKERDWLIKMLAGGHSVENTDLRGERPGSVQNSQNGIRAEKYN